MSGDAVDETVAVRITGRVPTLTSIRADTTSVEKMLMEELLYPSHGDADGATRGFGMGGVHEPGSRTPGRRRVGSWTGALANGVVTAYAGADAAGPGGPSWTWASTRVTWRCFSPCWPRTGRSGPATSCPSTRLSSARGLLDPHTERTTPAGLCWPGTEATARRLVQRSPTGRLRVATGRGLGIPESRQAVIRSPARWPRRGRVWRVPVPLQCCCHPAGLLAHEQGGAGPASAQPRGSAPVPPYAHPAGD